MHTCFICFVCGKLCTRWWKNLLQMASKTEKRKDKVSHTQAQQPMVELPSMSFLRYPLQLDEGQLRTYGRLKWGTNFTWFSNRETSQVLCILVRTNEINNTRKPLRILRSSITTLTQIWTIFLLSTVILNKHGSNLNMVLYCALYTVTVWHRCCNPHIWFYSSLCATTRWDKSLSSKRLGVSLSYYFLMCNKWYKRSPSTRIIFPIAQTMTNNNHKDTRVKNVRMKQWCTQ